MNNSIQLIELQFQLILTKFSKSESLVEEQNITTAVYNRSFRLKELVAQHNRSNVDQILKQILPICQEPGFVFSGFCVFRLRLIVNKSEAFPIKLV